MATIMILFNNPLGFHCALCVLCDIPFPALLSLDGNIFPAHSPLSPLTRS